MKYRLFKISVLTGKFENIIKFESDLTPSNIYKIESLGLLILYKNNHCIGLVDKRGLNSSWLGLPNNRGLKNGSGIFASLNYPSSLCRSKKGNICYVVESGGSIIRRIDTYTGYLSSFFGEILITKMNKYISKQSNIGDIDTSCCVGENETIYWSSSKLHRCFKFFNSDIVNLVGNGRSGYSVCSDISNCSINFPMGIVFDKGSIYIADSGNHCIRKLSDKSFCVIAGSPTKSGNEDGKDSLLNNPCNLKIAKNLLYFMDGNKIKCLALNQKNVETVYDSEKIISIEVDGASLLVLERE